MYLLELHYLYFYSTSFSLTFLSKKVYVNHQAEGMWLEYTVSDFYAIAPTTISKIYRKK